MAKIGRATSPTLNTMQASLQARAELASSQARPQNLNEALVKFRDAIYAGDLIVGYDDGRWERRHKITQLLYEILDALFGTTFIKYHDLKLAGFFTNYLSSYELKSSKFKKGIAAAARDEDQIELTKQAIISRLKNYTVEEERTIRVTRKLGENLKTTTTLEQLVHERKVLRHHEEAHLQNEEPLSQKDLEQLEANLHQLDTLIRSARKRAPATLCLQRIDRETVAQLYREKNQKKIYNKKNQTKAWKANLENNKHWLEKDLKTWKKELLEKKAGGKPPTPHVKEDISYREKEKILQTCCYPKFVALLKENPELRDEYYKFVFRDTKDGGKDAADIAIQLPQHYKRLIKCMLGKREGRLHDLFKIEEVGTRQAGDARSSLRKFVALKIDGEHCDIFDEEKKITFDKGTAYKTERTVRDVFRSFAQKNEVMGEYETIQSKGIVRLHGIMNPEFAEPFKESSLLQKLVNAISSLFFSNGQPIPPSMNLHCENWHTQMKPFESLSREEVEARYGVQPTHSLIVARATRGQPLDQQNPIMIDESHSFLELVTPNQNGTYDVFPIGKYAFPWPSGNLDTLVYIFRTQRGIIRMDENSFYNHRYQAAYAMQATPEQVTRFWEKMRRDIAKERQNEIVFQAQGDNCSNWVEETLDFVYQDPNRPRLYHVSYLMSSGPSFAGYILGFLQFLATYLSVAIANVARIALSLFFGAWRGYTTGTDNDGPTHRLITNQTWRDQKLQLPGVLFQKCQQDSEENMKSYFQLKVGHA